MGLNRGSKNKEKKLLLKDIALGHIADQRLMISCNFLIDLFDAALPTCITPRLAELS